MDDEADEYLEFSDLLISDDAEAWFNFYRLRYESGDKNALLSAIFTAANYEVPIPPWAAVAFVAACRSLHSELKFRSWDDIFGSPFPKGTHLSSLRHRKNELLIYGDIRRLSQDEQVPIDEALFERVGKQYGVGKTLCAQLYYDVVNRWKRAEDREAKNKTSTNS